MTFLNRHRSRIRPVGPFAPSSLFFGGIPGAWYDPTDLSTMFQDSTGTTPVTAVEQPVGLIIDKKMPFMDAGYRSIVFDGTGDYLTLGGQSAFAWGAGDFTVEFWFYTAVNATQAIFDTRPAGTGATSQYSVLSYAGGSVNYYTAGVLAILGVAVPLNTWTHVALCRSGTNTRLFINGTQAGGTYVDAQTYLVGASRPVIAADGNNPATLNLNGGISNLRVVKGTALYTANFTPSTTPLTAVAGTSLLTGQNATIVDNSSNAFTITVNGDTKTAWDSPFGANARQTTAASRPTYRARYNLLTYSEQFNNAIWTKSNTSITQDSATAPDGTATADTLVENLVNTLHSTFQDFTTISGATYTASYYVKPSGRVWCQLQGQGLPFATGPFAFFNVQTGTIGSTGGGVVSASIQSVGSGWYRCSIVMTASAAGTAGAALRVATADGTTTYAGDGTSGLFIWGAQLLTAADVTATGNAYQRIAAATVYDTAPVFRPYLAFDGMDDSLITAAINFTATDKMTVFAGVTKLASFLGLISELGNDGFFNAGNFFLGTGGSTGIPATPVDATAMNGNAAYAADYDSAAPPVGRVYSQLMDMSQPTGATEMRLRINAAFATINGTLGTSAGTGTFANAALNIGRRNSGSFPFNGRLYSLIVRGAASSVTEIADTELWVNARTGGY